MKEPSKRAVQALWRRPYFSMCGRTSANTIARYFAPYKNESSLAYGTRVGTSSPVNKFHEVGWTNLEQTLFMFSYRDWRPTRFAKSVMRRNLLRVTPSAFMRTQDCLECFVHDGVRLARGKLSFHLLECDCNFVGVNTPFPLRDST